MGEYRRQRQAPRTPVAGRLAARARATLDVRLLDLSLTGARLEHLDLLRPGFACTVELPASNGSMVVSAQVVWSSIIGSEQNPAGDRVLRYQSGVAFVGVTAEQRATLAGILERFPAAGGPGEGRQPRPH